MTFRGATTLEVEFRFEVEDVTEALQAIEDKGVVFRMAQEFR